MTDQAVRDDGPPSAPGHSSGGFSGRERELGELRADVACAGLSTLAGRPAPHSRVLLIVGRPGSGRTALAEELAGELAGDYPDGVLRARLSGPGRTVVPAERTARDLLAALGADPPDPGVEPTELTGTLRALLAERRVLLLLDDVTEAEQLLELLPENRDSLVVAVAGGPLPGVSDVRPCTLGGLDRGAAVELLRSRAGAAPRLTVDPRRAEALAEACGDLPAALRLVGGWLAAHPRLSVSDATSRLEEAAEHARPTGGRRADQLERAFQLVYGGLPRPAARLLRLLALAPAGFVDAHTASALAGCSVSTARETLGEFAALGLLRDEPHEGAESYGRPGPYGYGVPGWLDPLLRDELTRTERPGDLMVARARMLERDVRRLWACWAVAEPSGSSARAKLAELPRELRFDNRAQAAHWLATRRGPLLAAARLAVHEGGGELDTLARRLARALALAFGAHRAPAETAAETYRLHELVLEVAGRGGLWREQAATLLDLADLDAGTGRLARAVPRYRAALDAARTAGETGHTGRALESLGAAYAELGDSSRAADWYDRALLHQQTHGRLSDVARAHCLMGAVHTDAGRWTDALRAWRAAAAAYRRLREPSAQARALGEVARVLEYAGRPRDALRAWRDALATARRAEDVGLQAVLRARLGDTCAAAGEAAAARYHRAESARLLRHTRSDPPGTVRPDASENQGKLQKNSPTACETTEAKGES
ncbi:tetratricopeptide repeat protein [Streptomyces oceani]|uniref:tetratricopeptide repeat protein n=1 Tax=Streptomyces oceani TaxID=1075402 RepID=UPI00087245A4|nr:tetratricopeptide repeat protein [Streptomyces oceani]